jgi:DNA-binding NarL/FixJ family response regulator
MITRVLLVDDQAMFIHMLSLFLAKYADIEVVGSAANGEEALGRAQQHQPDVAVVDVQMPIMDGVETTRRLRAAYPACQVVLFSQHDSMERVWEGMRAGALSYVLKTDKPEAVIDTIRAAARGEARLSQEPLKLFQRAMQLANNGTLRTDVPRLTPREQDVLRLLDQSLSHRAIAERLTVSEESVGWYVKQLRKKLDAKGKDVPAVARELGLLN